MQPTKVMTVKSQGLTWDIFSETRRGVKVLVAWCEAKGYTKEFYGTETDFPIVDLEESKVI